MLVTGQSQSDPVKVKNGLEDSKSGALDPSGLNSRKSRRKEMGPGPKWFDSRNPEKKIKRGTGPLGKV